MYRIVDTEINFLYFNISMIFLLLGLQCGCLCWPSKELDSVWNLLSWYGCHGFQSWNLLLWLSELDFAVAMRTRDFKILYWFLVFASPLDFGYFLFCFVLLPIVFLSLSLAILPVVLHYNIYSRFVNLVRGRWTKGAFSDVLYKYRFGASIWVSRYVIHRYPHPFSKCGSLSGDKYGCSFGGGLHSPHSIVMSLH